MTINKNDGKCRIFNESINKCVETNYENEAF